MPRLVRDYRKFPIFGKARKTGSITAAHQMAPLAKQNPEPRRTVFFRDPQIANALIAASKAGIISGFGKLSEVVSTLGVKELKRIKAPCQRKGIALPAEVSNK